MRMLFLLCTALLLAGCGEQSPPEETVSPDSLEERNGLWYQANGSKLYSGWVKMMYDSGQVESLMQLRDGKPNGPFTQWYENGQKKLEATHKHGNPDGVWIKWYENGQKELEATHKNGNP